MSDSQATRSSFEVQHRDERMALGFWNNVVVTNVWAEVDVPRMRIIGAAYRELLSRHSAGIVTVGVLQHSAPVGTAEARAECMRFMKDTERGTLHSCLVIESKGVIGLMLRTVARGLNVLLTTSRLSIHDTVEDAIEKIAPLVRPSMPPNVILRELTTIFACTLNRFEPLPQRNAS